MKYLHLPVAALIILGLIYSLLGIGYFKWAYYQVENPKADFLTIERQDNNLTIIEFTNYSCDYCKKIHPAIEQAVKLHKDVSYVIRPVLLPAALEAAIKQEPAALEKLAMAAGMQGYFKEMHDSFMGYPDSIIPEEFIKETAVLYGIDYEKMVQDSKSKQVEKYLNDNVTDMLGINIQSIPSYVVGKKTYIINDNVPELTNFLTMLTNEKKSNE